MRVAVLGAGYAGVTVARRLEASLPEAAELVVVDDTGEHLLKHELHRAIRRPDLVDDLRVPLEDCFDRAAVRTARVTGVDPAEGVATLADGELPYDYAAVCLGADTDFHDLPGLAEHATPLQRVADARAIRDRFLEVRADGGRVVVGGAGLSGIQVAGELGELAAEAGAGDRVAVTLIEQAGGVAPGFPPAFGRAVRSELSERGVEVVVDRAVTGASADELATDAGPMAYDQLVWTGGIRGPDALAGDRPRVPPTMRLGEGTFVLGDASRVVDRDGTAVPASAQAALRAAPVAALNIHRLVEADLAGREPGGFDPRLDRLGFEPLAWVVSVGDGVVAQVGPSVLRGPAARAVKATAGIGHLAEVGGIRAAAAAVETALE